MSFMLFLHCILCNVFHLLAKTTEAVVLKKLWFGRHNFWNAKQNTAVLDGVKDEVFKILFISFSFSFNYENYVRS